MKYFITGQMTGRCIVAIAITVPAAQLHLNRSRLSVEDIDITIWKPIYFDGLSKHVLFETTGDVVAAYRSLRLVHTQISKKSDS